MFPSLFANVCSVAYFSPLHIKPISLRGVQNHLLVTLQLKVIDALRDALNDAGDKDVDEELQDECKKLRKTQVVLR